MADILVVDDDPRICRNLEDILAREGHRVRTTVSPKKALEMAGKEEFHLALVDLVMPGVDGMELLAELKRLRPGLPVIMITAYATVESAVAAMKKGAVDYIGKPFKTNEIQTTVGRTLAEADFRARLQALERAPDVERIISSLDNSIRRAILLFLERGPYPFSEVMKGIGMEKDPTKFNFHLGKLKTDGLVCQDDGKRYHLTEAGVKALDILTKLEGT